MSTEQLCESVLVRKLAESDFVAFDHLFRLYHKRLFHFSLSILKNTEDSEDVVQEVFIRIWLNRSNIRNEHSFKSYLFTIAYNIIVNRLKKRITDTKFREKLEKNILKNHSPEGDHLVFKELDDRFKKAISQLPPERKRIYKMHRNLGLTYKEIARKLDISPNTVRNQLSEALRFLREQMKGESFMILIFIYLWI